MSAIGDAIRAAEDARSAADVNSILNQNDIENIRNTLTSTLNTSIINILDEEFPQQLASNVKTILPAVLDAVFAAHNDYFNDPNNETKQNNLTAIDQALTQALAALEQLDKKNALTQELGFDSDRLNIISNALNTLNNSITNIQRNTNSHSHQEVSQSLTASKNNLQNTQNIVQENINTNNRANIEPEDITLKTKKVTEDLKLAKDAANDFRKSLFSLFNLHATEGLSNAANLFEEINKSALTANEAIERLHHLSINDKIDSPEAVQGANESLRKARQEIENLVNRSQQVNGQIAQASMGDITNFYTKLLNMGTGVDISTAEIKSNLSKLNISALERQQLEQALNENKQQIEELLNITHQEFTTAFTKKIDDIVSGIDTATNKTLNQFAVGRGLSQKYISSFNQAGQASTNIWQIATGIEQTKDRFSIGSFGFGRPNLSSIKENASVAGQMHFELQNSIREFAGLHDKAIELKQKGLHNQSQAALNNADKLFESIANIQAEFSARALRAVKKWNQLSEKEKKRLDPTGQMDSNIKTLSRQLLNSNTSVISLTQAFNIKMNSTTKRQLEQLRQDTKDIVKLDQEVKKSKDKTEFTIKQLSNFLQSAINEIRSTINSTRQVFNTFGNLGTAFLGPIESLTKIYEYYRKQGHSKYAAMGTDAYIGYSNLDESADRAYSRLMAGNDLYERSGGRIDREIYDKQYQAILKQIGGRYGSTPEQAVQEAEELSKQTALLKSVYGVDDSSIMQALKTYFKDMDKSPTEAMDALAKLTVQAQAANIPLGQYLSKVSSLSETFMQVGIEGEQASIILNQLLQNGIRMEVAESVTSQVASVAGRFSENKNKIAFTGVLQGEDPFHAIAMSMYTHTADGKPREGWGKEIGKKLDTWINTVANIYGDDPDKRRMGVTDILKGEGFDQRASSMLASVFIEQGNNHIFQDMLVNELEKKDNPNATMESLNKKINTQLEQMVNQLAKSDKLSAQLDSKLYREAKQFGNKLDSILQALTPAIIEFQKQMLKFAMEALKLIQKLVTSDIFKNLVDSIVKTISDIPNFLKDLEGKLDELIGWGQSLIEGNSSDEDKNAKQLQDESHAPFSDTTSLPATGLGVAAGMLMPGGIIGKTIGTYVFTTIFDKIGDAFNNAAAEKDTNGNVIKDSNGNIQYKNTILGDTVQWFANKERPWNDDNNSLASIGSIASTAIITKTLGNIPALSLTREGSALAKAGRFGVRGAIAIALGGLIKHMFSDSPTSKSDITESDTNKSDIDEESAIDKFFNLFSSKNEKVLGASQVINQSYTSEKQDIINKQIAESNKSTNVTTTHNEEENESIFTMLSNLIFTKASAASLEDHVNQTSYYSQNNVSEQLSTNKDNKFINTNTALERISVDNQINKFVASNIASNLNEFGYDQINQSIVTKNIFNQDMSTDNISSENLSIINNDEQLFSNNLSHTLFTNASITSLDKNNIVNQNTTEKNQNETAVLGTSKNINQEQASLFDILAITTGITAGSIFTYNFATGFFKQIGESLAGEEALSPWERIKNVFKHFINILKTSFTDIKNIINTLYKNVINLPNIIANAIKVKFTDIKNYIKSIPNNIKTTFRAKIIDNWQLAKHQVNIENKIKEIDKLIKETEKKLKINPNDATLTKTLEGLKRDKQVQQVLYAKRQQKVDLNTAKKWLPEFQSSKYQKIFNEFDHKLNNKLLNRNVDEYDSIEKKIQKNKTRIANINEQIDMTKKQINIETDADKRIKLQKQLERFERTKNLFEKGNIVHSDNLTKIIASNKTEFERVIGTTLSDSEFTDIKNIITENKDKQKTMQKLTDYNRRKEALIESLRNEQRKLTSTSATDRAKFNRIEKIISKITDKITTNKGEIKDLEKAIKQGETNLGKQINDANTFLRRVMKNGFSSTKTLISKTSSILGEALTGMFDLTKVSITNTAQSMLEIIGKVFGDTAKTVVDNLFKRAKNVFGIFEHLLNGIKQIAKFFKIGGAATEATKGLGILSKVQQVGKFLVNHIPGLKNIINKFKALPPAFKKGAKWVFNKIPMVNAVATAGSFGIDFVSNLERGADWTTALKVALGDNAERIIEAAAMFGGPIAWAGYAANNLLPILHMFGFNVPDKTLISLIGDLIGVHASYSEDEKITEFSKDLAQKYPELAQKPELLKQVAAGQINLEQALASIISDASLEQMSTEEMQKWLEQEKNTGNELAARISDAIAQGKISIEEATDQLHNDPKKLAERIAQAEQESNAADDTDINDDTDIDTDDTNTNKNDNKAVDKSTTKEKSKVTEYKRKYKDALKELERIKTLENISDIKKQELIKSLIDEQITNIDNDYTRMKDKINISNLSEEKKTEVLSKLKEEHIKHIDNIEKLKTNQITEEQFNKSYIESKKSLEEMAGLYFTSVSNEENIKNINQRYYVDPIKEAQRILSISNDYNTEHKQMITNLSNENINRVDNEYQYMLNQINNSSLTEDKKKEAIKQLNKQYEVNKQQSNTLKKNLINTTNVNEANTLLQQFQQSYDKSKKQLEDNIGLKYKDVPETADEAEESRSRITNKMTNSITDEQKKMQNLQYITNITINEFMDLHEELMASLQKNITEDHKNIYDSIGITHKILLDLQQSIAKAGAAIAYTISRGSPGTGNSSNALGDISTITNHPEIEAKLEAAAKQFNVDPALVKAIAQTESGWNQDSISPQGAIGVMQLMPSTAASLGVNPNNIDQNIYGGVKYLKQMLDTFNGNVELAVAAYNAGPGAVKKYGKVPPYSETQNYVRKVLKYREGYVGREVLPKDEKGQSVGNHSSERKARQNAAAIAQGEITRWTNDNEQLLYETLSDMVLDGKHFSDAEIAGIMAYVKYANPNFDAILNNEHGGIFALGGTNKERTFKILKELNKDPNNKLAQIVASIRALGTKPNNKDGTSHNVNMAKLRGKILAEQAGWDDTDIERVMEQAEKYFKQFSNQTVLGVSEEISGANMYALNDGRQPKPVDQGGANVVYIPDRPSGGTYHIDPQTGYGCTNFAGAAFYNSHMGTNYSSISDWASALDSMSDEKGFTSAAEFQSFIANWFKTNPNSPLFLFQVAGAGNRGNHAINKNSGHHATNIIGLTTDEQNAIIGDPLGGKIYTVPISQVWDDTAGKYMTNAYGDNWGMQGMTYGNTLWVPRSPKQVVIDTSNLIPSRTGSVTSSATQSYGTNPYAHMTEQDIYNHIIGAPIGFKGTYNIDPYKDTYKAGYEKLYIDRMRNIEEENQKRTKRYEQRKLELEQKYGSMVNTTDTTDTDKTSTTNKTNTTDKTEVTGKIDATEKEKETVAQKEKRELEETKAQLEDLVRRTIDVEYTYNSNNTLYTNRLIQEQTNQEELARIANYHYKYTTKPQYITEALNEQLYTLPYTYEAINKIPEYDLISDQQDLYQSNKESSIITEEEYNTLNEDEKEEYTNISAEKHITAEQFQLLSEQVKQYYTLNNNAINNNYKTAIQYQQLEDKTKYKPITSQLINQEKYDQLPEQLQKLYSINTNIESINQAEYNNLSEEEKKNYTQKNVIAYKKSTKSSNNQYIYEKINKANEYKLQEQYKSLVGTPLYQSENPITEKDGIVTIDFEQAVAPQEGLVKSGEVKEELTFEEWNTLPEELKNKYAINTNAVNQNYISQNEWEKLSQEEKNKYRNIINQKEQQRRISNIKNESKADNIHEIEEIITQEQYNRKSKNEQALYEPTRANVYYRNNTDKQYQLNNIVYAKDNIEAQNILNGNLYRLANQSDALYQLTEPTDETSDSQIISQEVYQQLSKEEQAKYKQMNEYIDKIQYNKLNVQDQNKYTLTDINNIITQQQWNKLTDKEKQQYSPILTTQNLTQQQFEQLPQHIKELYQLNNITKYRKKKLNNVYESISKNEAFAIANQKLIQNRLKFADDNKLLDYYNIKINDEQNKQQIIKNIRQKKDLQGKKIDKKELTALIDSGLTEDQAYIQYLQQHDTDNKIDVLGDINTSALYELTPNYADKSKRLPKINILRSKQQTEEATRQIEGYEKGKKVSFWTDESGAEKFYNNQQQLYTTADGKNLKQSDFFTRLLGIELEQITDGRERTEADWSEAATKALQKMSQWQEFNMNSEELMEYLGININQSGYLGDIAREQIYSNIINGLAPSGKPWIEDIMKADAMIRQMIAREFTAKEAKEKELQDQINLLKTKQDLNDGTIHRLAMQYTLKNDETGIYTQVDVTDPAVEYELKQLKLIEELYTPGEKSFTEKHPEQLVSFNTYYGGLWGETSKNSYGGLTGEGIWRLLSQPNANGEKIINYNPDKAAAIRSAGTMNERIGRGWQAPGKTYGDFTGKGGASILMSIPSYISGTTPEAQARAKAERETWRTYGDYARKHTSGELDVKRVYNDRQNQTNYTIRDKVTGGKLNVTLQGNAITEQAMRIIADSIRKGIKEYGGDLFESFDVNMK